MQQEQDLTLRQLFGGALVDGEALIRAEARLVKEIGLYRARKAKGGIVALALAAILGIGGTVAFLVGIVLGLAPLVGPIFAGVIVFAVTGAAAFLLVRYGAGKLADVGGDAQERAALAAGEQNL